MLYWLILPMWKNTTTGDDLSETTLLIDAHCVMCNGLAGFLNKRLKKGSSLTILGLQSEEGQALVSAFPAHLQAVDSLFVVRNGKTYIRSAGAIRLLLEMRWYYAMLFPVAWLVPLPLRDAVYWMVSKIRHRFGRTDD